MKMLTRILVFVSLACGVLLPATGYGQTPEAVPPAGKMVDAGGGRLWMETAGTGGPTVVLEYGLGGPPNTWQGIFPEIAKFTRVVQYHRAGYGHSDAPWAPYNFISSATTLRTMLKAANIPGPYVLVGHSLGNAHIRAFAHLYPEDVAGMVFIDPFNARVFELASEKDKAENAAYLKEFLEHAPPGGKAEGSFVGTGDESLDQLKALRRPPDVPMIVLIAGRNEVGSVWPKSVIEEYGPWLYEASEGGLVLDPESSHYVHRDNPELVISSIKRVVFPSVTLRLARLVKEKGVEDAVRGYREMRKTYPLEYFRESDLNSLGYQRLREKDVKGAIKIFELNVEMYPQASNPYDSLGEAYMADGQNVLAVKNYRRSLELNPNNTNAVEMLKKLEGK